MILAVAKDDHDIITLLRFDENLDGILDCLREIGSTQRKVERIELADSLGEEGMIDGERNGDLSFAREDEKADPVIGKTVRNFKSCSFRGI